MISARISSASFRRRSASGSARVFARPDGTNVADPGAVRQPQLTEEAIMAHPETPFPSGDGAGDVRARCVELARQRAGLVFAAIEDSPRVDRQAVVAALLGDAVDDHVVLTRRWVPDTDRGAAP